MASTGSIRGVSTPETASYSQMTAPTVRVSGTELFQSAAMQGNNSVVNCEGTAVSCSSQPRPPLGGWRLDTKYRGYSCEQANLTGISSLLALLYKPFRNAWSV
eukprot:6184168-Pleurochrysis_carterae.AAC.1